MKRNYKLLLVVVAISVGLWSFIPKANEGDPEKDKLLLEQARDRKHEIKRYEWNRV